MVSSFEIAAKLLGRTAIALVVPLLFVYFYLVLFQRQTATLGSSDWSMPMRTDLALFVYGDLLAGLLGSLLKSAASRPTGERQGSPASLGPHLFVGSFAAFAATVLLPTALLIPPAGNMDPFAAVNKWGLILLAFVVGYASRDMLGDLTGRLRDLFENAPGVSGERIEEHVEAGLKRAITPAPLANFEGFIAIGVLLDDHEWLMRDGRAQLHSQMDFELAILFGAGRQAFSIPEMIRSTVSISDGVDLPEVFFDIIVDGSTIGIPLSRQAVAVRTPDGSAFLRIHMAPRRQDFSYPSPSNKFGAEERHIDRYISVSFYQGAVLCGNARLPVDFYG